MAAWYKRLWSRWTGKGGQPRASAYQGAVVNRLTADWIFAVTRSADQEAKGDLTRLRARARELVRNNAYAARFVDLVAENVIGPHGIRLQARVTRGSDGEFDRRINDAIEAAWHDWCAPENASADGRLSWVDIQHLAARSFAQDGEALIRMLPGFNNPHGFALQLLDPDQLDHEYNRQAGDGRNEIRMGVEIDAWGRPVAYHIWNVHPQDHSAVRRERIRVPAEQMIHLYRVKRPGQTRGVTEFAAVLLDSRMLAGYQEAELVAARTAAAKMGFFTPDPEAGVNDPNNPTDTSAIPLEATPGTMEVLPTGWTFQSWDPQHPSTAFKDFTKSILRSISTGLGVSYNSLANDLEAVNYSSIRAGLLSERDAWKRLQVWVYTHLHRRVYLEWMKWALTMGALELPSRNVSRWRAHQWLPRGWDWVDPLKDITAGLLAVRGGLDSRTRLAGAQGRDFEDILADLDREQQLAVEYGVELTTDTSKAAASGAPASQEDPDDARAFALAHDLLSDLSPTNGNGNGAHAPRNRLLTK